MPLTAKGKKVLSSMRRTYVHKGGEKKAKSVFYASINAGKPGSSKWHAKKKGFHRLK